MRYHKILFVFALLLIVQGKVVGQNDPKVEAIEKHYQYLESETKASRESMAKEATQFREFIQAERKEHKEFLERTYVTAGIIVTIVISFLTFFGWSTFKGIRDSRKELEAIAAGRLVAFENSMTDYRSRFSEAQQNLQNAEAEYNHFLSYYRDANPKKGRYLLMGPQVKLEAMQSNEMVRFVQAFGEPELAPIENFNIENFYPASYDLIVYRSNVDGNGEDADLQRLIQKLKEYPETPIVIYAAGQSEYIKNQTDKSLREYGLFHMATNPVTLIDNVASAYRVAKMLPKKPKGTLHSI